MEHQSKAMQIDVRGLTDPQKHIVLTALSNLGYDVKYRRTIPHVTDVGWYYTYNGINRDVGFDPLYDTPCYGASIPIYVLDFTTNEFRLRDEPKPADLSKVDEYTLKRVESSIKLGNNVFLRDVTPDNQWLVNYLINKHNFKLFWQGRTGKDCTIPTDLFKGVSTTRTNVLLQHYRKRVACSYYTMPRFSDCVSFDMPDLILKEQHKMNVQESKETMEEFKVSYPLAIELPPSTSSFNLNNMIEELGLQSPSMWTCHWSYIYLPHKGAKVGVWDSKLNMPNHTTYITVEQAYAHFTAKPSSRPVKPTVASTSALTVGSIVEAVKDFTYSNEPFSKGQWGTVVSTLGDKHALVHWEHKLTQESYKGDHVNWIVPLCKLKLSDIRPKPVVKVGSRVTMCRDFGGSILIRGRTSVMNHNTVPSVKGKVVKIKKYKLGATEVDVAIVATDADGLHYNVFVDALEVLENV